MNLDQRMRQDSVEVALSNYLILQNLFSHLNYPDLLNCAQVSTQWRSQCERMNLCLFKIKLSDVMQYPEQILKLHIGIKEIHGFGSNCKAVRILSSDFQQLLRILRESRKKCVLSIELKIRSVRINQYKNFLRDFGEFVHVFGWQKTIGGSHLSMDQLTLHLNYCPNVMVLKCADISGSYSHIDCRDNPNFSKPSVQRICFRKLIEETSCDHVEDHEKINTRVRRVLQFTPNVQEIFDAPINSIPAILAAGKIATIKSLTYPYNRNLINTQNIPSYFAILAENNVRLNYIKNLNPHEFFKQTSSWARRFGITEELKERIEEQFLRVLQSSDESIHFVRLEPGTGKFPSKNLCDWSKLQNLKEIELESYVNDEKNSVINPLKVFGQQVLKAKKLTIGFYPLDRYAGFGRIFPSLEYLEIQSHVEKLQEVFPIRESDFPNLKSLTMVIGHNGYYRENPGSQYGWDCVNPIIIRSWDGILPWLLHFKKLTRLEIVVRSKYFEYVKASKGPGKPIPILMSVQAAQQIRDKMPNIKILLRIHQKCIEQDMTHVAHECFSPVAKYLNPELYFKIPEIHRVHFFK